MAAINAQTYALDFLTQQPYVPPSVGVVYKAGGGSCGLGVSPRKVCVEWFPVEQDNYVPPVVIDPPVSVPVVGTLVLFALGLVVMRLLQEIEQ